MASPASPTQVVIDQLTGLMGAASAQSTLNTFCKRTVGVAPEKISAAQLRLVLPSLQQLLSVLVGQAKAQAVIASIQKELST